jgi:predicted RNA-binding Zn-ribbon protein involved in translation (DUF1610 family)
VVTDFNLQSDKAILLIDGKKVASKHTKQLRENFSATEIYSYYQEKYLWSDHIIRQIWWETHGNAFFRFGSDARTSIQKFIHNRMACNERENKFYTYRSPFCHVCKIEVENHHHVLKCPKCNKRNIRRKQYLMDIKDKLKILGTNDDTSRTIVSNIQAWLYNQQKPILLEIVPDASDLLRKAVAKQDQIGRDQWFRGRISSSWGELYSQEIQKSNPLIKHPSTKNGDVT